MNSPKHSPTSLQNGPGQIRATARTPHLPPRSHSFRMAKELDPNLKFDPSDIFYSTELRCPNCDRISEDSICSCGATIQHPDTGELP